jgi:hypothetical protein
MGMAITCVKGKCQDGESFEYELDEVYSKKVVSGQIYYDLLNEMLGKKA